MNKKCRTMSILVVDDEKDIRKFLVRCLEPIGIEILQAENIQTAREQIQRHSPDILIVDVRLPDGNGLEILKFARRVNPACAVFMLTAFDDSRIAVEAIRSGATDYLLKPVDVDTIQHKIQQAIEFIELKRQIERLDADQATPISFHGMIGRSPAMKKVFRLIQQIAPTQAPVLITGESGTGKRLTAEILHRLSPRRDGPFIVVDCGTIPTNLIESELFGYAKGAFTGADRDKPGRFKRAHNGTLFLDEISNLPLEGQAKILRFLDEGIIQPLGQTDAIELDVRVIVASNDNLKEAVQAGRFREDLYYRLNVFEIHLPPLRERPEDISLLAEYFLGVFNEKYNKQVQGFQPEVIHAFLHHTWPGNVRELRNAVERGVALATDWIGIHELPPDIMSLASWSDPNNDSSFAERARRILEETERLLIEEALERAGGNRRRAAELLGISLRTLYYKIDRYMKSE